MIWREGVVPEGGQQFDPSLSEDLLSYGYALLEHGIELVEADGSDDLARLAFRTAATAIESVIARGSRTTEQGFHRVVAATCFHLAGFSARAYSLLHAARESANISLTERCLVLLMLRDLDGLSDLVSGFRARPEATDSHLADQLYALLGDETGSNKPDNPHNDVIEVVDVALTDAFMGTLSIALLAFERGDQLLLAQALERMRVGLRAASTLGMVPQWWSHRLAILFLRGLWGSSFHVVLPHYPAGSDGGDWERLRATFVATLFRRSRAEIELWPSQLEAAARVLDTRENLVLSLPTSAGKTRIAELCILATLAEGRRAVFITPLRALSAQTEVALERTFIPLGKTISTLYGTTGISEVDENILQSKDIVVATPEKLDFALRNDPSLLDDVGLIVFDEGHMIGAGEREVRYELQMQRLLRRVDAADRRIICLSAVLPQGDQVEDFVNWLTNDHADGLISSDWRPTVLRYGEVIWRNGTARLDITVGEETPFVPRFLEATSLPSKTRRTTFPHTQPEFTLATAWRLIDDGQTVLIFCPQKNSVTSLAKEVVKLTRQGALRDIFDGDPADLDKALTIGSEWFPSDHPVLVCLKLGIAVHHGSLPGAYRKEIERLLQRGVLKVTISSPTLAQGLNLAASALVVHSLWRNGSLIEASEFRNIVGRAGRAFVDSTGLVVHPIFQSNAKKRRDWADLVENANLGEMQSGLVKLVTALIVRMAQSHGLTNIQALTDYVMGQPDWSFPELTAEDPAARTEAHNTWKRQLASLDTAILALIGESAVDNAEIAGALDNVLASSLWSRTLARYEEKDRIGLRAALDSRAAQIWEDSTAAQRRGWYLAGVGMHTGHILDTRASELESLLRTAEAAIELGIRDVATEAIIGFARICFAIFPFAPTSLPDNWEQILEAWLHGEPVTEVASDHKLDVVEFVEGTLAYRLPWALESVRVRAAAHESTETGPFSSILAEHGLTVAAVETGTLSRPASLLIRAGFSSRSGAISAIATTDANFTTVGGFREWLDSEIVLAKSADIRWPSTSTNDLWSEFTARTTGSRVRAWVHELHEVEATWGQGYAPTAGDAYRARSVGADVTVLETADARRVGTLAVALNQGRRGLLAVTASEDPRVVILDYRGPSDLYF